MDMGDIFLGIGAIYVADKLLDNHKDQASRPRRKVKRKVTKRKVSKRKN